MNKIINAVFHSEQVNKSSTGLVSVLAAVNFWEVLSCFSEKYLGLVRRFWCPLSFSLENTLPSSYLFTLGLLLSHSFSLSLWTLRPFVSCCRVGVFLFVQPNIPHIAVHPLTPNRADLIETGRILPGSCPVQETLYHQWIFSCPLMCRL